MSEKNSKRASQAPKAGKKAADDKPFRFYDNRQKYLAFVNTTKREVEGRRAREPRAGAAEADAAGAAAVRRGHGRRDRVSHLMRAMHRRFPVMPFFIVGKEISLEDVRLSLEKLPDRFIEHPASVS